MLQAAEAFPINLGFLGKGNSSLPGPLEEQIRAGACGFRFAVRIPMPLTWPDLM